MTNKPIQLKDILKNLQELKPSEICREIELTQEEISAALKAAKRAKQIYNDDPLTEFEVEETLMYARKTKQANQNMKDYTKKLYGRTEDYKKLSAIELYEKLKAIPGLIEDEFNTDIHWKLCLYFSEDPLCPFDLNKGLLLYGPIGCGKTKLMRFFSRNPKSGYLITSTSEVAADYATHGHEVLNKYKHLIKCDSPEFNFGQRELGICFDDLGWEMDKKNYGNESNVLAEILFNRYSKGSVFAGKTHVTTNLNSTELEERYGKRVRSRLREMFNVIAFDEKCPDRRK